MRELLSLRMLTVKVIGKPCDRKVMHGLMRRGWRLSYGVASEALSDERDS